MSEIERLPCDRGMGAAPVRRVMAKVKRKTSAIDIVPWSLKGLGMRGSVVVGD